ncbi:hypothetical protein SO802_028932 [Lithocarpus litseifolius]|uniref:Uncharacterized protein n=1 Tax=Lithocarpus litseifolius TaxID=425828 RepID=A0AAW2BT78_9ROSI
MANQLESLVQSIKSKVRALKKKKKPYVKMDKSSSVKVEIRSRKARKLIDKTLKVSKPLEKKTTQGFETILEPFRIGLYIRNKVFFLIMYI